jgi:hypothetical protein
MLTALMTLLATLSSIFRSRAALELENLALRHQIGVLRRAAAKRLKLTPADRLLSIRSRSLSDAARTRLQASRCSSGGSLERDCHGNLRTLHVT